MNTYSNLKLSRQIIIFYYCMRQYRNLFASLDIIKGYFIKINLLKCFLCVHCWIFIFALNTHSKKVFNTKKQFFIHLIVSHICIQEDFYLLRIDAESCVVIDRYLSLTSRALSAALRAVCSCLRFSSALSLASAFFAELPSLLEPGQSYSFGKSLVLSRQ